MYLNLPLRRQFSFVDSWVAPTTTKYVVRNMQCLFQAQDLQLDAQFWYHSNLDPFLLNHESKPCAKQLPRQG
jgi:hypothetical protein